MLGRVLKMAFWVMYDHLGKLTVAGTIWSAAWCIPAILGCAAVLTRDATTILFLGIPLLILSFGCILPAMSAGLAHMVKELIDTRDGSVRTMFSGIRLYGVRAVALGMIYLAAGSSLAVSVWFYAAKLGGTVPVAGYGLSALALWLLVFVLLTTLTAMPTLVQKKAGIFATMKLAALLTLDNLFLCIGLGIQVLAVATIALIVPPVFFFLYGGLFGVLTGSLYEMLARKYAALEARQAAAPATGSSGRHAMRLTRIELDRLFDDEQDDYLNRGLRDFLFPWKG